MERYEMLLTRRMVGCNIAIALLILIAIATPIIAWLELKQPHTKKERVVPYVFAIIVILASVTLAVVISLDAAKVKKDLDNQDYVVYYGEYEIKYNRHTCYCYIYDSEECIELLFEGKSPDTGIYTGYIVYARNSLIAVDWYD